VTVHRSERDGVRVLRIEAELDVAVVPGLLARAEDLLAGARDVVLDLGGVPFFDSSGVRLVDRLARLTAAGGGRLVVASGPGTPARRVLEIVGLAGALVHDDVDAAVTAVRSAGA
jgi:anti-anti-sigma factor